MTVTSRTTYTSQIYCENLSSGLMMTLGPEVSIGTDDTPVSPTYYAANEGISVGALSINAYGDGDEDIVILSSSSIYSDKRGVSLGRDGAGILRFEHKAGRIVSKSTSDTNSDRRGIHVSHTGKENTVTKGIHIISAGDIDLSAATGNGKGGIDVTTRYAKAGTTIPIRVEVTGGTIDASASSDSFGDAISVEQFANGNVDMTIGPETMVGTKDAIINGNTVYINMEGNGVGNVRLMHHGKAYGLEGIRVDSNSSYTDAIFEVTTGDTSVIESEQDGILVNDVPAETRITHNGYISAGHYGIRTRMRGSSGISDVTITHNGSMVADRIGILVPVYGNSDVTIITGENSNIDSKGITESRGGINASVRDLPDGTAVGGSGGITVSHKGKITAMAQGIFISNRKTGTGNTGGLTVTTEEGSMTTADRNGIKADIQHSNASGDIIITHNGKITAKEKGLNLIHSGTGNIMATTGEDSMITADIDSITADIKSSSSSGDVTITHNGMSLPRRKG